MTYSLRADSVAKSIPIAQKSQPFRFSGRLRATTAPTVPQVIAKASEAPRKPHDAGTLASRVARRIATATTETRTVAIQMARARLRRPITG